MPPDVARNAVCSVGSATLTTEPSMKASDDPRIVATSIHLRSADEHGEAVAAVHAAEQGGTTWDFETTGLATTGWMLDDG